MTELYDGITSLHEIHVSVTYEVHARAKNKRKTHQAGGLGAASGPHNLTIFFLSPEVKSKGTFSSENNIDFPINSQPSQGLNYL